MKTKALLTMAFCLLLPFAAAFAQDRNSAADNILGKYFIAHGGEDSKAEITRTADGTYSAKLYWVDDAYDENGNKRTDDKNPDKELRNVPCDQIVLFWDLKYNAGKKRWDSGKIYDPTRGLRVNLACHFDKDGRLVVKGSLLGFSETMFWQPISE